MSRRRRLMAARGAAVSSSAGVTLLELLVASVVAGLVLAGAWSWLWNIGAAASRMDEHAQAATAVASAARAVTRDVHTAVAVLPAPAGRDPGASLYLARDPVGGAPEHVLIVWDRTRGVLWRNASGTYLSDHVASFAVSYVTDDGRLVPGALASATDLAGARDVRVELCVEVGAQPVGRTLVLGLAAS